eukprot:c17956_g1_i1 orf=41-220(-)
MQLFIDTKRIHQTMIYFSCRKTEIAPRTRILAYTLETFRYIDLQSLCSNVLPISVNVHE